MFPTNDTVGPNVGRKEGAKVVGEKEGTNAIFFSFGGRFKAGNLFVANVCLETRSDKERF